ncbi:hypothetical protein GUJ93_ZPchr0013g35585 [Zizania palustris]|uniref:Pentatricopeptide repeat-containing protein n=1 Tax=Zizania palustris TaxID=103762 RepID=A0A8J6C402_ZIZPA|nr:hypothetical protein GUJ93_ZPchr0013g35585 [Zizania palustris]
MRPIGVRPCLITLLALVPSCNFLGVMRLNQGGRLHKAYDVIQTLPVKVTKNAWGALLFEKEKPARTWGALLVACRTYGVVGLAEIAGRALFEIQPDNAGNCVSLVNIYSGMSMHEEAEQVRREMEQRDVRRLPGRSWMIHRKSSGLF